MADGRRCSATSDARRAGRHLSFRRASSRPDRLWCWLGTASTGPAAPPIRRMSTRATLAPVRSRRDLGAGSDTGIARGIEAEGAVGGRVRRIYPRLGPRRVGPLGACFCWRRSRSSRGLDPSVIAGRHILGRRISLRVRAGVRRRPADPGDADPSGIAVRRPRALVADGDRNDIEPSCRKPAATAKSAAVTSAGAPAAGSPGCGRSSRTSQYGRGRDLG